MSLDKGVARRERVRLEALPLVKVTVSGVLIDVSEERRRQVGLWGTQDHTPHAWLAILAEETGEVAKEIADGRVKPFDAVNYRTELIHVAAVAVAAIESLDRAS